MRDIVAALVAGIFTALRRPKLVLALWLGRFASILLFFTLPLFGAANAEIGRNPQARAILDAPKDGSGFAFAWTTDFVERFDPQSRVFWAGLAAWLVVSVLAPGFVAAFVLQPGASFLETCGRFAGRFVRLALLAAVLVYLADAAVNAVLFERHLAAARAEFTEDYAHARAASRGVLFAALFVLLGAVHSYARIDLVAHDRRSAFLSFGRGFGILFLRLPKLLAIEIAMLLAAGAVALLAGLLMGIARPGGDASWLSFGFFVVAASVGSYLRTGIELGTLEARCRILVPPAPPLSPLETVLATPPQAV